MKMRKSGYSGGIRKRGIDVCPVLNTGLPCNDG